MGTARQAAIANESRQIDESQSRAIAAREQEQSRPRNALEAMANRLQIKPAALQSTLRSTVFSGCKTDEEFFALVIVSNEYGLNPLLKEIFAFPGKGGGIVPMVSIDGWIRIMNEHPQFDGIDFEFIHDEKGKIEAVEAIVHRKDRSKPIKVIEFLEENYRSTDPWKLMPRRMLRHRALIQAARIAFGFSGIVSEGEEDEMINITPQRAARLPDSRSLAEELDDEIPHMDRKQAEQVDEETGEITDTEGEPTSATKAGMTEVDEETARKLDAGEDADSDQDEDPTADTEGEEQDSEESPTEIKLREYREQIEATGTPAALKKVDEDWVKNRAAFDDDAAAGIDKLITAKRNALNAKKEG